MSDFNANNHSANLHNVQNNGSKLMRDRRPAGNMLWAVLFFFAATVGFTGCIGDIDNVPEPSTDTNLSKLTVTPGALQPAFSSDVTNYTVDVANDVDSVTVTAQPQDPGATVSINGQTTTSQSVSLGGAGSSTTIPIIVTAQNGNEKTYFVTVNRLGTNNANLSNLTVTPGSLQPAFNANTLNYTVDVNSTVGSVTVTATKADANATVFINEVLGTSRTINLPAAPSSTEVNVQVIAQDGTTTKTYVVDVNRLAAPASTDAGLSSLTVSTGTLVPVFVAPGTSGSPGYTVTVPNAITSVTVTAVTADSNASLTISPSSTVNDLQVGNTEFTIVVTAQAGNDLTYFVTVIREP